MAVNKILEDLKNRSGKTLALLTAMCALSSCVGPGGMPIIPNIQAFGKNGGASIGGGYYPYAPMMNPYYPYMNGYRACPPGMAPGDIYMGRNSAGQGVIRVAQPMLSADAQDMVTRKDADGNEWKVAKGTKLPKTFKVVVTEDKTIPVPAAQYDQITAALSKGELSFVVDANGQYGLAPKEAAKDFKTGTMTFEQVAKMAQGKTAPKPQGKGSR